jgi:hypothetical protein
VNLQACAAASPGMSRDEDGKSESKIIPVLRLSEKCEKGEEINSKFYAENYPASINPLDVQRVSYGKISRFVEKARASKKR